MTTMIHAAALHDHATYHAECLQTIETIIKLYTSSVSNEQTNLPSEVPMFVEDIIHLKV